MEISELTGTMGHELVTFCNDPATGLKAIIAVHSTTLGPALGGCRFWDYKSESEALMDVLRLSRGMTYKNSVAGLGLGGGKAVIIGDPKRLKSEAFFRAFGAFVDSLGGRYITAEDVNICVDDIALVSKETPYVTGLAERGGAPGSGDPSPFTALGVFSGLKAAVSYKLKKDSLKGITVGVQGCGAVGSNLCRLLAAEGVRLMVADIDPSKTQQLAKAYDAKVVPVAEIHTHEMDVFAPCALGGILNEATIPQLKTTIVAGGANNQLLEENQDGERLRKRGILYAPDYVINAGGVINVSHELRGYNAQASERDVRTIHDTMLKVFNAAEAKGVATHVASNLLAEDRIRKEKESPGFKFMKKTFHNQSWIKVKS